MNSTRTSTRQKVVVVHRGARDAYQVSRALSEAGRLESLLTDLYWPWDRLWAKAASRVLPPSVRNLLLARSAPGLPSSQVTTVWPQGPGSFLLDKLPRVPFAMRQRAQRGTDAALGTAAGEHARRTNSRLLSYSYYGYHAFSAYEKPGTLFQLHPHPASVRAILARELERHPDCAPSLEKEWELSLPDADFDRLVEETKMASSWLCASSFTRRTLVEQGIPAEHVRVVPYGVDLRRFHPGIETPESNDTAPLRLLFVGTINQRKGIKYLLEALRLINSGQTGSGQAASKKIELTVCGRVVDDLKLFEPFGSQITVRPSVSFAELLGAYRRADLFVLPSVAEGFAQVLLEALACGLPILSTTHTAAPDLIDEGIQGFVVEPARPDSLAERIEWSMRHRGELRDMKVAARKRAQLFTWARFRERIIEALDQFEQPVKGKTERITQHV